MPPAHEHRRPALGRGSPFAHRTARTLIAAGATPNQVSVLGIVFAALAGGLWFVAIGSSSHGIKAAACIAAAFALVLRLVCNLLDGLMAMEGGQRSATGEFFNEVPERVSDVIVFAAAGAAAGSAFHGPLLGATAALLAVLTAYVRVFGVTQGQKPDFSGPLAKPQRMAVMALASLIGAATPLSPWPVEEALAGGLWIVVIGTAITALRRVARLHTRLKG